MKRLLLLLLLVLACPAFAQNQTTVTGTLTDPNGIAYYPATVLACLSPSTLNPKVGGNTIQFPVLASTNYTATCHLYYQAAATGGLNIEFTGPASPTAVRYGMDLPTALTAVASGEADAFGSSIGAVSTNGAANLDAMVSFSLINGANAGTVNLLAKSSAAVQLQIQSGSYCQVQ